MERFHSLGYAGVPWLRLYPHILQFVLYFGASLGPLFAFVVRIWCNTVLCMYCVFCFRVMIVLLERVVGL